MTDYIFYTETEEEKVADVVEFKPMRDVWVLNINGLEEEYTQEYLEYDSDMYLGDDLNYVYRQVQKCVCSECKTEPLYDQQNSEPYCPVCEMNNE